MITWNSSNITFGFLGAVNVQTGAEVSTVRKLLKLQMKCFFIPEFERAAKLRKIAVYRSLISLQVPEL